MSIVIFNIVTVIVYKLHLLGNKLMETEMVFIVHYKVRYLHILLETITVEHFL